MEALEQPGLRAGELRCDLLQGEYGVERAQVRQRFLLAYAGAAKEAAKGENKRDFA